MRVPIPESDNYEVPADLLARYLLRVCVFIGTMTALLSLFKPAALKDMPQAIGMDCLVALTAAVVVEAVVSRVAARQDYRRYFPGPFAVDLPVERAMEVLMPILKRYSKQSTFDPSGDWQLGRGEVTTGPGLFLFDPFAPHINVGFSLKALSEDSTRVNIRFYPVDISGTILQEDEDMALRMIRQDGPSMVGNLFARPLCDKLFKQMVASLEAEESAWTKGQRLHARGDRPGAQGKIEKEAIERLLAKVPAEITGEDLPVLKELAQRANYRAQYLLGCALRDGYCCEADHTAAATWLEYASAGAYLPAMHALSCLYRDGLGVPQDDAKAKRLCEQAGSEGYVPAEYDLIVNFGAAPTHLLALADRYKQEAYYYAALVLEDGKYATQDLDLAAKYYQKAADNGDINARYRLARLLWRQAGSDTERNEAVALLQSAARDGHTEATAALQRMIDAGAIAPP